MNIINQKLIILGLIFGFAANEIVFSKEVKNALQDENNLICPRSKKMLMGSDIFGGDKVIDWPTLKKQNVKFIFIKATEGEDFVNDLYYVQKANAKANKIIYAPYHFFHPEDDPHIQAKFFLDTVGNFDKDNLPPMLDWEDSDKVGIEDQVKNAKIWLDDVEKAIGVKPIIYLTPSFFNKLGNPKEFSVYPLFIADYDVPCPLTPKTWKTWTFWQVGSKSLEGIPNKNSDINYFNGNHKDLKKFIKKIWASKLTK